MRLGSTNSKNTITKIRMFSPEKAFNEPLNNGSKYTNMLQLKIYDELKDIERDVHPKTFTMEYQDPGGWIRRGISDIFGVIIGYGLAFIIADFIRSTITHTPLFSLGWMYFGPMYYISGAPLLTSLWKSEVVFYEDEENNACIQTAEENYQTCRLGDGSFFHCQKEKTKEEMSCFLYGKCSNSTISSQIQFYIDYVPKNKHVNTSVAVFDGILGALAFPIIAVDKLQAQYTGVDPLILFETDYEERPNGSFTEEQLDKLTSNETVANLKDLCMEKTGVLGLRVRGLTYNDIDNYFKKYIK